MVDAAMSRLPDVFSADEVARATGVPISAVHAGVATGILSPIDGAPFFSLIAVLRAAPDLRARAAADTPAAPQEIFARESAARVVTVPEGHRVPLLASSFAHVALLAFAAWLTVGETRTAVVQATVEPTRLVFLLTSGPGGGGGGSGANARRPASRLARPGATSPLPSSPASARRVEDAAPREDEPAQAAATEPRDRQQHELEPLAAAPVIAPVVVVAASARAQEGAIDAAVNTPASRGPGQGGDGGAGRGIGVGDGVGRGIDRGEGGGTGGGPYRPGSGIQPPRLLREVKAEYPDEARRRGVAGEVILEIVVLQDGSVGHIRTVRGLGSELDQRAVAAVRQWRFAPATRNGQPVDVLVEVAVEFTLR
jgi:TonB family protein